MVTRDKKLASGGFILFDVMLALVILGASLTMCIHSISNLTRASRTTFAITLAAAYEQSILADIAMGSFNTGAETGSFVGNSSSFSWEVSAVNDVSVRKYLCRIMWNEFGLEKSFDFATAGTIIE